MLSLFSMAEPLIRNISDTARWAALYRARETERSDAIFRDPFARRLAGERGEDIANEIQFSTKHSWSWTARTYLFDQFLLDALRDGYDMVINLAAGLDARPYEWICRPPKVDRSRFAGDSCVQRRSTRSGCAEVPA